MRRYYFMYTEILKAAQRLQGVAHKTPVLTSRLLNAHVGSEVFIKCENLQRGGAFKFRGAYNAISALPEDVRKRGIVTFSSGNHGMATAYSCKLLNAPATIVVPHDAPEVKIEAIRGYGANIVVYNRFTEDRETISKKLIEEKGYTLIPPFDHQDVLSGQGTLAKELIEEVGSLDYLFVQVGGGGLIAGCSIAAKQLLPEIKVIGVEPQVADDVTQSFACGQRIKIPTPNSVADGLNTPQVGGITFPIIQNNVHSMVNVSEQEILETMYFLWTRAKILCEPSGAVSTAAAFFHKVPDIKGKRIGVVISGGNVDVRKVSSLFA